MLFVCWLWRGRDFWKPTATYDERHVDTLAGMLRRHGGHELICVQDGSFEPVCPSIFMPPHVAALPDYLPKLWAWSPALHGLMGQRFASIDLDVVILGDLAPVLDRVEPLVIWDQARMESYNTSLFAVRPGYGNAVWESYTPERLARARKAAPYWTGDQSWVGHVLGTGEATFGEVDGVAQYRPVLHRREPPAGTLAAFMCGPFDPRQEAEASNWVRDAYR